MLGPSGSGKSSLVRAGVLPRLRRDPHRWLVLAAFRPRTDPLRELAIVIAQAQTGYGRPQEWPSVHRLLTDAAARDPPRGGVLTDLAVELQIASGHRDARVVLTLDQVEELLGAVPPDGSDALLKLLRAAVDRDDCPLLVIGTLRSDFLGEWQQHPAVRGLAFDDIRIGPLTTDGLVEVINGPARVAGVDIEPGLTEALIETPKRKTRCRSSPTRFASFISRSGPTGASGSKSIVSGLAGLLHPSLPPPKRCSLPAHRSTSARCAARFSGWCGSTKTATMRGVPCAGRTCPLRCAARSTGSCTRAC